MTLTIAIAFYLVAPTKAMAQEEISGQVNSQETGDLLPGVNITVKGTTQGTFTDGEGNYSLAVPTLQDTLIVSFVGFQTREIPVNGRSEINIQLQSQAFEADEMVVVGYGSLREREITGSVSRLDSDEFDQSVSTSVSELIQGKASGVQVVQNSGEPGGGISIDIRGVGSINAGSSPLYVIDGLPIDNSVLISGTGNQVASNPSPRNPLSALNPQDIESIEILKDASATAIYGSRGSNGVILVTTKKGESGNFQINYNAQFGVQNVHNRLDLLSPQEYMNGINSLIDVGGGEEAERVEGITGNGTNWQDVIFNDNAPTQKHNLNFSWGNSNTTYLVAVNTTQQQGLVENSSFDRYGSRFNLSHNTEKFNMGFNGNASYIKDKFAPNGFDVNLRGGAINAAKLWDPTRPVRDESGDYFITDLYDIDNPQAIVRGNHIDGNRYRFFGTVYGEYFILPQLAVKLNVGGDFNNENKSVYKDRTTIIGNSLGGVATAYEGTQSNYLIEGTLNFRESFQNHDVNAVLGVTTQKFLRRTSDMQANNFVTDATLADNFSLADRSTLVAGSGKSTNQLLSYLGRINYTYSDKYIITASYRVDGSSRFGSGNKFGYFPSLSVGWLIDQEEFFSPLSETFSLLKLRASWGRTGNQEIGNNRYLTTFNPGRPYVLDDEFTNTLNPSRTPNPDLKWETTEQYNIGLDFSLLEDKISGAMEWYKKDTYDMLLNLPIPRSSGYGDRLVNIGGMTNTGFEFSLSSYNFSSTNFSWNTDLNLSTIRNEVTDLGGINQIFTGSTPSASGNPAIIVPGEPLRSFFGYDVTGIWQESDDFTSVSNNNQPGDFKFRDINDDGVIDGDDRVILGNSFPDFSWGIGNTFNYNSFQLHFFLKGVQGIKMINGNLLENYFPRSGVRINRLAEPFLNRWTPQNATNDQPSYLNTSQLSQAVNSRTVVDASYVKLQTVRLSYNIPSPIIDGLARSAEIYVSGQNLLTISDYEGFDPALNPNGNANFRIDWNGYPSATTYLIGINLSF
jgi:TonB-linked SusC/RagA family outer membrane protein